MVVAGRDLPKIGWCGEEPLDPARFIPPTLARIDKLTDATKPHPGGLWCSPVVRAGGPISGQMVGTAWTDLGGGGIPFTVVWPHKAARVVVINDQRDLAEAVHRWPDRRPTRYDQDGWLYKPGHPQPVVRIDWPAMAQEIDAVYVTDAGIEATRHPFDGPHLWGWDVPTVLFLRPAFNPGRIIADPPSRAEGRQMDFAALEKMLRAATTKDKISQAEFDEVLPQLRSLILVDPADHLTAKTETRRAQ